jgi:hypothetical protein
VLTLHLVPLQKIFKERYTSVFMGAHMVVSDY